MISDRSPPNPRTDQSDVWYYISISLPEKDPWYFCMRGTAQLNEFLKKLNSPSATRPFTQFMGRQNHSRFGIMIDLQKVIIVQIWKGSTSPPQSDQMIMWIGDDNEPPTS